VVEQYISSSKMGMMVLLRNPVSGAVEGGGGRWRSDKVDARLVLRGNVLQPTLLDRDVSATPCILFVLLAPSLPLYRVDFR
jgi:hypothetical protein